MGLHSFYAGQWVAPCRGSLEALAYHTLVQLTLHFQMPIPNCVLTPGALPVLFYAANLCSFSGSIC